MEPIYTWKEVTNLFYLQACPKCILEDDTTRIETTSICALNVLPVKMMATALVDSTAISKDEEFFYLDESIPIRFRFPKQSLTPYVEWLCPTGHEPKTKILWISLFGFVYSGGYIESYSEPPDLGRSLVSILLQVIQVWPERTIYPLTFEFDSHPKVDAHPDYHLGLEIRAILMNQMERNTYQFRVKPRLDSILHLSKSEDDSLAAKEAEYDLKVYNQRLVEFTGLRQRQIDRGLTDIRFVITGSAMAYCGFGGDLSTYADADIDICFTAQIPMGGYGESFLQLVQQFVSRLEFRNPVITCLRPPRIYRGYEVESRYQFQIPGGRRIDFYLGDLPRIWIHHVAPVRMYRNYRGFHLCPSAQAAYATGIMNDLRWAISENQSGDEIIQKYVRRGFRFEPYQHPIPVEDD